MVQVHVGATPWRFESSHPHPFATLSERFLPLSSRGLGRRPLAAETGVRIPVAVLTEALQIAGFSRSQGRRAPADAPVPSRSAPPERWRWRRWPARGSI